MWVHYQVDPGGRGHGGRDLGHAQAARLDDLGAAGEGEQGDGDEALGAGRRDVLLSLLLLATLDPPRGQGQQGLQEIARDQPAAAPGPDDVRQLAREAAPGQEQAQGDGDVGRVEGVPVEGGEDEGDGQEDGVARLVGDEAVVVGEGDGVCCFLSGFFLSCLVCVQCGWMASGGRGGDEYIAPCYKGEILRYTGEKGRGWWGGMLHTPWMPMQNVKRSSSISTNVEIRTVSLRCLFVLERRETGVDDSGSLEDGNGHDDSVFFLSSSSSPPPVGVVDVDGLAVPFVTWAGSGGGNGDKVIVVVVEDVGVLSSPSVDDEELSTPPVLGGVGDGSRRVDWESAMVHFM